MLGAGPDPLGRQRLARKVRVCKACGMRFIHGDQAMQKRLLEAAEEVG